MNVVLFKQISILSLFFGGVIGLLTLAPYVGTYGLIFLLCFIAPLVIWLLIKYNCLSLSSVKDSIMVGAIAGFVAYIGFSIIYLPVSVILIKIFNYSANQGVGLMINHANLFILSVVSIFMGVVGATINSFTGFITFYVMELFKSKDKH